MSRLLRRLLPQKLSAFSRRPTVRRALDLRARLLLDALEGRIAPATFTVSNANDGGAGSLRQAILDTNSSTGPDLIGFDPAFFNVARTISLTTGELLITDPLTIAGTGVNLLTVRRDPAAGTQFRVFDVNGPGVINVAISAMTITGGNTAATVSGAIGDGGGLLMFNDNVTLTDVAITGNTSGSHGGGVGVAPFNNPNGGAGTLIIRNSTISGNTANGPSPFGGEGGGISFTNSGSLLLENSTVSGNRSANSGGGGLYFSGDIGPAGLVIRNSTISGNTAASFWGGVALFDLYATAVVQNCTIAGNTATGGGGGGITVGSPSVPAVNLTSTVVANNTSPEAPDVAGTVTANFSLIRDRTGATVNGSNNLPAGTDPMLGLLANNGGPTQTMALLAGSPLINAGSNPAGLTTDQRGSGFARVSGAAADIGAFEVQAGQASVQSVVVNAGQANLTQRSMVTNVTVTFDRLVTFNGTMANAFQLARTGPGTPTGNVTLLVDLSGSTATQTVARLTFSGPLTEGANSLVDGNYTLTVYGNQVQGGLQNGDNVSRLHRLFGDVNGDKAVNGLDLTAFRNAFDSTFYVAAFDFNGDGAINGTDLTQFRNRFGVILP